MRSLLGIFLLVLALTANLDAQARREKDPVYIKTRAERMMAQLEYEAALKYLSRSIGFLSGDAELRILAGECLFLLGRFDEAAGRYEEGVEIDPALAGKVSNLPLALVRAGKLGEAEAAGKRMARAAVDDHGRANASFVVGLVAWHRGHLKQATREFQTALRLEPRLTKGWYRLGLVHLHEKRAKQAAAAFEKVLELDRLHHAAAHNLALARIRNDDREGATAARRLHGQILDARREIQQIRDNLAVRRRDTKLLKRLADIYFRFECWHEAAPIYAAVTAAEPVRLDTRLLFARCKMKMRDLHAARIQCNIILQRDPENAEAKRMLEEIHALVGEPPTAEKNQ